MTSPAPVLRHLENTRLGRYGEMLLVKANDKGAYAEVYNTYTHNDCPDELWHKLDLEAITREEGAILALANGPRYWLVDSIDKVTPGVPEMKDFGGMRMARAAVLDLSGGVDPSPYRERRVARTAIFTFNAGSTVYEMRTPEGKHYVMQSWCISEDPALDEPALAGLGGRLNLPEGWTYGSSVLGDPIVVNSTTEEATVLQDDLRNTYSLVD